jgi:hypothetical protein
MNLGACTMIGTAASCAAANPDRELRATARRFGAAAAHNGVTVPESALHQGHGRMGGRTGFRTPNRDQRSAAQLAWRGRSRTTRIS